MSTHSPAGPGGTGMAAQTPERSGRYHHAVLIGYFCLFVCSADTPPLLCRPPNSNLPLFQRCLSVSPYQMEY
ncbi:hypothetical protein BDW42DRAFT_57984 [Aspergillus taichungensis]|uniref:Uncharacterized protein n=1 Tax=Aspergillus taichungensis TaxID=482145 RepID=A0A2J5I2I1_9EURO|nr:hypothetical protein BDW42DRAFT_57984 [Aspergillus taichungensis]